MNMAVAYSNLTVPQLKGMLDARHADHKRELADIKSKWAAEVAALREAASKNSARLMTELQTVKNVNAALQRELDAVHVRLEQASTVIVEQGRKLAAHDEVTDLEKKLLAARRRSA